MTLCAYCQMDANNVDPEFSPECAALPSEETCASCGLPPLGERTLIRAERTLGWKLRWERDELENTNRAESIAEQLEAAWGGA